MIEAVVFAGPSGKGLPAARWRGLQRVAPAKRGDIDAVVAAGTPSGRGAVIVLADGIFGFEPAVSHAELCRALDAGWQVWGCSSMGAIRAWEMRHEGMRGQGWVYRQFARHRDLTDDELALLHLPTPPWDALSVPLVDLRHALHERAAELGLAASVQRHLIDLLRQRWFGERTATLTLDLLVGPLGVPAAVALALLDHLERRRIKNLDLDELLRQRPWRDRR